MDIPIASIPSGTVSFNTNISLSITTQDAEIWYSIDGSIPMQNGITSYLYATPIIIQDTTILKAIGIKENYLNSDIMIEEYDIEQLEAPIAYPLPGDVAELTLVTLTCSDVNAEIWYTVDGSNPEKNGETSILYTTPITINFSMTIKAIAWDGIKLQSPLWQGVYSIPSILRFITLLNQTKTFFASVNGITWQSFSLPEIAEYNVICYGTNKWVILKNGSKGYYSENGTGWMSIDLPISDNWSKLIYANNMFIAIAGGKSTVSNNIIYSYDGVLWHTAILSTSQNWIDIAYGLGRFICIASGTNESCYSLNGIDWIRSSLGGSTVFNSNWSSICFGNNKFVIVSEGTVQGASNTRIIYSDDGISFSVALSDSSLSIKDVLYGNNKFVAALTNSDKSIYSLDGIDWVIPEESNLPQIATWNKLAYLNNRFIMIAQTTAYPILYSNNGVSWGSANIQAGYIFKDTASRG